MPDAVHAGDRSFSWQELVDLSSARKVRTALDRQEVARILPGRYCSRPHLDAFVVRAHASSSASVGSITGLAALFIAGAEGRAPWRIDLALPDARRAPRADWLTGIRTPRLPPAFEWRGCRVALPEYAAIHLWARGTPTRPSERDRRVGVILSALQSGVTTSERLTAAMEHTPRIRDRRGLEQVLDGFAAGAESFLEFEGLTTTFAGRVFARFIRQHVVHARGRVYRLDMYDPATRTAVELDGGTFHAAGEQRERDDRRDADLATLGIQTVRLPYKAVVHQPAWCRETVLAVLRARERQAAA
ncbi:DUF559 domain-containing protein [Demequina maris]|uniref:DUF559 domain-containing protein n=1 Tax=Demequina maris TaxID=1638982 RepID=UPI00155AF79A|nr:DUF559 domain-containing protein [Demequina maris]